MTSDIQHDLGPFAALLGLRVREATPDSVVANWSATEALLQPFGLIHGGVHCSVVETLASVGAALWLGGRGQAVGVSNTTDFFRSIRDGELVSTATPLHREGAQQIWMVETIDTNQRLVARGNVRLQNLYHDC